jgi:autotransporter-associated beta strand protein
MNKRRLATLLTSAAATWAASHARAVVWNGTDHPERGVTSANGLTDQVGSFSNVAVVTNNFNSTRGTATYLANGWIITARHVVQGANYGVLAPSGSMSFNGISGALTIAVPDSAEIGLVKLQTNPALSALPSTTIYTGSSEGNTIAQLGGFGYWGFIDTTGPNTSAVFHRAYNIAYVSGSFVDIKLDGESRLSTDGLLEGGGMPGDSGSPLFILNGPDSDVNIWSEYQMAGILATSDGSGFGGVSSYARVRNYGQLIKDIAFGSGRTLNWARGVAGNFSWNNSTLNGDVTNGNNWSSTLSPAFPNGAGDFANVGSGMGANNQTIDLDQNITVGEMTLGSINSGTGIQTVAAGGAFTLTFNNQTAPGMIIHNANPNSKGDVISAPIVIGGTGSLLISNPSVGTLTIGGNIGNGTGASAIGVYGSGTVVFSGSNSYTGGTSLESGTLVLGSAGALSTTGVITCDGGTLQYSASNQTDYSSRFSTAAGQLYNIDTNGQSVTFSSGLISSGGSLTKLGTGKLTLLAASAYSGDTNIQNGTLAESSIGSTGRINFGAGANTGALLYTGTGETSAAVLNLGAGLGTGGGVIDQEGTGLLKFTTANTATGGQKHTLTLTGSSTGSGEIAGAIVDNSAANNTTLQKTGTGTWTLSGPNTYTGQTIVSGGVLTLAATGSLASTTINLSSSSATMNVNGTLVAATTIFVNGTINFGASEQIASLTLSSGASGSILPSPIGSPTILQPATLTLKDATSRIDLTNNELITTGTESSAKSQILAGDIYTSLGNGTLGYANAGGGNVEIRYTLPGDADLNGIVNTSDFMTLASNFAAATPFWAEGDFNNDGVVNALDFNALASNFGASLSAPALSTLVPEPGLIGVLTSMSFICVRRRRV